MRETPAAATSFVGVAFRRGLQSSIGDEVVMQSTGGPYVHSEFILGRAGDIRCYTACGSNRWHREPVEGFIPVRRMQSLQPAPGWDVVTFPLNDGRHGYNAVYAFILQLVAAQTPYNHADLWQCCVKAMLPFERDVRCEQPDSWRERGVFCSQACLLLLRHLSRQGCITLPVHVRDAMERVNSRGCSPNSLFRLVHPGLPPVPARASGR